MVYSPPSKELWKGRNDPTRYHDVIRLMNLNHEIPNEKAFVFIGFACDEGIARNQGRVGAAEGPKAFRTAFAKLPVGSTSPFYDAGDIVCTDGDLEKAQQALAKAVQSLLKKGMYPIVIGGGHEVAWGHYQGIAGAFPDLDLSIINLDAHLDIRPLIDGKGTSGTSFLQIAKASKNFDYTCIGVQEYQLTKSMSDQAKALKVKMITAEEIQKGIPTITFDKPIYLTICMDVFAAACAPGVSAPQPLGLFPWQVLPIINALAKSGKVMTLNVAELSPPHDRDQMTANLAAALVANFCKKLSFFDSFLQK